MKGYDKQKRLFLPPATPGGKLPEEILQAWAKEKQSSKPSDKDLTVIAGSGLLNIAEPSDVNIEQGSLSQFKTVPVPSTRSMLMQLNDVPPSVVVTMEGNTLLPSAMEGTTPLPSTAALDYSSFNTGGSSEKDLAGLDASPVVAAVARHKGIDLSSERTMAEFRKGIAIVLHGPPQSGCTSQVQALARRFKAAIVGVDALLKDLISYASTPAGNRARKFCLEANKEKLAQAESGVAVSSTTYASIPSKKPPSKDNKDKELSAVLQEDVSPVVEPFSVQPLPNKPLAVPECSLLPTVLPEEIIVEILSDRLQETDCRHGIVFDGIDTPFITDPSTAMELILKAINNRKHIYVIQIKMELTAIKDRICRLEEEAERKTKEKEEERKKMKLEEEEKVKRLLEIDEDEYETLSEEKRKEIDDRLLEIKKAKRQQKVREKEEQERLKQEKEEEERRLAEEMKKKKGKGKKTGSIVLQGSPSQLSSTALKDVTGSAGAGLRAPSQSSIASAAAGDFSAPVKRSKAHHKMLASTLSIGQSSVEESHGRLTKQYQYRQQHMEAVTTVCQDWNRVVGVDMTKVEEEKQAPKSPTTPRTPTATTKRGFRKLSNIKASQSPTRSPPPATREGLGVPVVVVEGDTSEDALTNSICESLPAPGEVWCILLLCTIQLMLQ